ncbi:MAG: tyrosine-type recombinase/integrase [Gordonia sp. (in: high G+C Gram-positive bacteria)]|uniref:tyrosine-type recombinase/integrase n=1 Tax=Gordonia sp. (in: high G+C Gram-positive bacteria) TaxID=84139 RepID=UPI003C76BB56
MTLKVKPVPPAWVAAIDDFCSALRAGGSPHTTIATRRAHIRRVGRELGGTPFEVESERLVAWCGQQDWAVETRRGVRASLLAFYRWAVASDRTRENPANALPKVRAAIPSPRPAGEITYREALVRADSRARLILRLAAEAGLRRAEVAQVHSRDLIEDLSGWSLIVHGKGGRQRVVPLPDGLASAIRERGRGWAFPGDFEGHLSPRWVGKIATELLPGDTTMHQLRHRFATRAYSVDHDMFTVQELLGHSSPETTRRYVLVPRSALRDTVRAIAG